VGAYLIWKSDLPDNDKIISIIAILALFSLVSIVNEAKKGSYEDVKFNIVELEKNFFTPRPMELEFKYRLALLNDVEDWVESSLNYPNLEDSSSCLFALVVGEENSGKSIAFQEYVKLLQAKRVPAVYIDIKDQNANLLNLMSYLKITNMNLLEEAVERFNSNSKTPVIVLDDFEHAFSNTIREFESSSCPICQYLKILYDSKKVNIIMITNQPGIQTKLFADEGFSLRTNVYHMKPRKLESVENYFLDKVNYGIGPSEKRFTKDNTQRLAKTAGFTWDMVQEYVHKLDNYRDVDDFTKQWIQDKAKRKFHDLDVRELVNAMLDFDYNKETNKYENKWITYGQIKKWVSKDTASKLDKTISLGIVKNNNEGRFQFLSDNMINLALVSLEKRKFEEL
jgi:hypothetical protein